MRESLLALLVLALAFLNFGHTNLSFARDGHVVAVSSSFCGNPLTPADADHTPCHACRIGQGADLPLVPCGVVPVAFTAATVTYSGFVALQAVAPLLISGSPRAPPFA